MIESGKMAQHARLVRHALARLAEKQGDRARRNARTEVRAEVRALVAKMDALYPAPARKLSKRRKRAKPTEWGELMNADLYDASRLASAGIKLRIIKGRIPPSVKAPAWAVSLMRSGIASIAQVKAAKRDIGLRRSLLAQIALAHDEQRALRSLRQFKAAQAKFTIDGVPVDGLKEIHYDDHDK
jgi:hypothetical protein